MNNLAEFYDFKEDTSSKTVTLVRKYRDYIPAARRSAHIKRTYEILKECILKSAKESPYQSCYSVIFNLTKNPDLYNQIDELTPINALVRYADTVLATQIPGDTYIYAYWDEEKEQYILAPEAEREIFVLAHAYTCEEAEKQGINYICVPKKDQEKLFELYLAAHARVEQKIKDKYKKELVLVKKSGRGL